MVDFYITLAEHLEFFLFLVVSIFGFLYLVFRRHILSVFDPLLYYIVLVETFCIADVLFMAHYELIEQRWLVQYMLSEIALFVGILLFRVRIPQPIDRETGEGNLLRYLYLFSLLVLVGLN